MEEKEFNFQIRNILAAQTSITQSIQIELARIENDFESSKIEMSSVAELDSIMSELESSVHLLAVDDFENNGPIDIEKIYERSTRKVSLELKKIGFKDWDSFVLESRAYCEVNGVDPYLPFGSFLEESDFERLRRDSFSESLRWDKADYFFVYASGVLAAITDFLLVKIPKDISSGLYAGQEGGALTEWVKNTQENGDSWFNQWAKKLEKACQTPYDRQEAIINGEISRIAGMNGRTHRLQALGHDPILGFVFGILDILRGTISGFSYDRLTGNHGFLVGDVFSAVPEAGAGDACKRGIEAIATHLGHLISDVNTPMGLPAPLMGAFQAINAGDFGARNRSVGELARWMYLNGYDFRHFLASGITPAVIEIVLRFYIMFRHYQENGEAKFRLAGNPKYRSMLLTAHGVAASANAGKLWLYQGNPLAINQAQWMALIRYLVPHIKYWVFDKKKLEIEHMEMMTETAWTELTVQGGELLRRAILLSDTEISMPK